MNGIDSNKTNNRSFFFVIELRKTKIQKSKSVTKITPNIPIAAIPSVAQKFALTFVSGSQYSPPITKPKGTS